MEKLQELRDAYFERQHKNVLMDKISKQFDQINRLKREKEKLQYSLQALKEGRPALDLYPSCAHEDSEFLSLHYNFASLKQKLSTYRLLGPCGLTVLDVQTKSLAVSFTSVWKNLTLSFLLHIADDNDKLKVAGTTIPYFIDVESMLSNQTTEPLEWPKIMDRLGYLLNAYTQRRREVEYLQSEYKTFVNQISYNDPVTVVDINLSLPNTSNTNNEADNSTLSLKVKVKLHLVYNSIHDVYPSKISLASSHFIPKSERDDIRKLLKINPLSQAFPVVMEKLGAIRLDADDDEEEEEEEVTEEANLHKKTHKPLNQKLLVQNY